MVNLNFEEERHSEHGHEEFSPTALAAQETISKGEGYDHWLLERKVRLPRRDDWHEGELGDSCCFGTRTVESSMARDCIWKIHGAIG